MSGSSAWDIGETVAQTTQSGGDTGTKNFFLGKNPNEKQDKTIHYLMAAAAILGGLYLIKRLK